MQRFVMQVHPPWKPSQLSEHRQTHSGTQLPSLHVCIQARGHMLGGVGHLLRGPDKPIIIYMGGGVISANERGKKEG